MNAQESDFVQITSGHRKPLTSLSQGHAFTFPAATDLYNSGDPEDRRPECWFGYLSSCSTPLHTQDPILHPILKSGLQPKSPSFQTKIKNVTCTNTIKECIPYAGI